MPEILIRKPTSTSIPRYWLFLDWNRRTYVCRFSEYNGKGWHDISQYAGPNSGFFNYLCTLKANRGTTINIVAWGIYEFMCSADIYQAILDRTLVLTDGRVVGNNPMSMATHKKLVGGMVAENPPTIIDAMTGEGQRIKILDIGNWGIARKDIDDGECPLDCDVGQQAMQDYIAMLRAFSMGQFKYTAASQGYYCYRLSHMQHAIYADNSPESRNVERASYFAGRAECFRLGKIPGKVFHVDVKAMYTAIGQTQEFPVKLIDWRINPSVDSIRKFSRNWGMIAHVGINTDLPVYPVRIDKRVLFPIGKFDSFLSGPELLHAYNHGRIERVYFLARYQTEAIFSSWSRWYFEALEQLEQQGLGHMRGCLKLCVNSMYGKIGQRSKLWKDDNGFPPRYPWEQWWGRCPNTNRVVQFRSIDGSVQYLDSSGESATSCPGISSFMSSYGRIKLWDIMCTAGLENCYYCDTDGLMTNEDGYSSLCQAGYVKTGVPGSLQVREISDDVEIFGIKHYRFGSRWCCSGVPEAKCKRINGKVEFEQHSPFADGLWHRKAFEHEYRMIERSTKREYKHGLRNEDGSVYTFIVGMEESIPGGTDGKETGERIPSILGSKGIFASQP